MNKLNVCKITREIVADCLYETLSELLEQTTQFSEVQLRDNWLAKIRTHKNIFRDGWYIPPPHGVIVLFGADDDIKRISTSSMRPEEFWPKDDIYFDKYKGIMFLYFSSVDKKTGIIGDFGMSLYFGKIQKIKDHLKLCFYLDNKIFDYAQVGMRLSDITKFVLNLYQKHNLTNNIASSTDSTGTNVGHTIPVSYEDWNEEELKILKNGKNEWQSASDMISKKRMFENIQETLQIKPGMAITIEPRPSVLNDPTIPMVYFHTIALFKEDGTKELLTNFDKILNLVKMDYIT